MDTKNLEVCSVCGDELYDSLAMVNGKPVCEECFEDNYSYKHQHAKAKKPKKQTKKWW